MADHHIMLHHYPQSPVSEKIRIALGMLDVPWTSVEIPRLPPKPKLMPLTGGYRLTPVMQIGADVYCDTKCILGELSLRVPNPAFFKPMDWALAQWTDGPFFKDVVSVAIVEMAPNMPPEFLADRGPLYFGPDFSIDDLKGNYANALGRVRTQLSWAETQLRDQAYLAGDAPSMADALVYYLVWFLRDRMAEHEAFFGQFPALGAWEDKVRAIGHGTVSELSGREALTIAAAATPEPSRGVDAHDPLGLAQGDAVTVTPMGGGPAVTGTLHSLTIDTISLMRTDDTVGHVCTHFPRLGYQQTQGV